MALIDATLDSALERALSALSPYSSELVVVGGCANALYRYHELAAPFPGQALGTRDVDLATPRVVTKRAPSIASALTDAGFTARRDALTSPPVMKFVLGDSTAEIEFLVPLTGAPHGRRVSKIAEEIQPGLTAQALRYLDLLLLAPWTVPLARVPALASLAPSAVRVPNPASYVMQKVLIRDQNRASQSRDKDCYYMYEVAVLFRDALDELARVAATVRASAVRAWSQRFARELRHLFASPSAEGSVAAARVHAAARRAQPGLAAVGETEVHGALMPLIEALLGD